MYFFIVPFLVMDLISFTYLSIEKGLAFIDGLLFISEMKNIEKFDHEVKCLGCKKCLPFFLLFTPGHCIDLLRNYEESYPSSEPSMKSQVECQNQGACSSCNEISPFRTIIRMGGCKK